MSNSWDFETKVFLFIYRSLRYPFTSIAWMMGGVVFCSRSSCCSLSSVQRHVLLGGDHIPVCSCEASHVLVVRGQQQDGEYLP